jgi:hypothetical protein
MQRLRSALLAALCFGAVVHAQEAQAPMTPMTPMQAIERAADAVPRGISGTFEMDVRATGTERLGPTYLNSEDDYRDPRCLTVVIPAGLLTTIERKFGESPATYFKNKRIRVTGFAKRTRIDFTSHGRPTGKYYYQTHVRLQSADHIEVVDAPSQASR